MRLLSSYGIIGAVLILGQCFFGLRASAQVDSIIDIHKKTEKQTADMMYFDAVKALMLDQEKEAMDLLKEVIVKSPQEAGPYYELSRLYMKGKDLPNATENIKKAVALNDKNKWYKEEYGTLLAMGEHYADAADVYKQLATDEKQNEEYEIKAVQLYQRAGKDKEALAMLDKMIARKGNDESYLILKYQVYAKMNNEQEAAKIMQQLIDINPQEGQYYRQLAELYESTKQPAKAFEVYKKAEQSIPGDFSIQLGLAEHYYRAGDTATYVSYMKKLVQNKDVSPEAQINVVLVYMQYAGEDSVKKAEGEELARQLAGMHDKNYQVQDLYGQILLMNGQPEKAAEQYKKTLAIDQSHFDVWRRLLAAYGARKDADSLIKYSEKAIRLFPNQAAAHFLNGIGYMNKKDYKRAANAINRAIDFQPEEDVSLLTDMYSTLGDVYNMDKQYTLSDSSYEKAMRMQPNDASLLNNYSYYLSERGVRLVAAEKMSKHALELRPGEATFLDTYGWILYKMGKYEKAKEYVEKAVNANPRNADATLFEHLGDIYYKLNETDKAVEYWKQAKQKGSDDTQIDKKINERKLYE